MCRKAKAVITYCFDGEGAPALARHKSAFRRRFNGRWLRWKAWRGLFRVAPLARYFSFPMKSATATDTAIETFESVQLRENGNFTSAQMDAVVLPALASDKIRVKSASPGCTHVLRETAILADCAVLGHVGALVRGSDCALLYQRGGGVPNWKPTGGELMFFSRGSVKLRRLLNEAELEAMAARHGFQRFEAVSANHPEQVQRFGNADVIVAVHGAGLANLLFARPGTIVVELFPEDFVKSTYLWLSNRLGLRHIPVVGSRGSYDQDFRVDPAVFSARLDEAMALTARPLSSPLSPMQVSL
jgi:capsular polysaccharide biosynthesis protein